ncbi:toll/interleukin-1 receptor domain-containing protein [Chloroflexota bacterium]
MATEDEYDVFVSYAWEDKSDFVKPLVDRLIELGLKVWYDELSLDLGDSLRENIDRGLGASKYGIVVLSLAFFSKRWPARELNGLVQKAMGESRKVILPIWHGVTQEEVATYSLPLSDILAARSDDGIETVADSIVRVVRKQNVTANVSQSHQLSEERLLASAKRIIADPTQIVGIHELADALARDAFAQIESCYNSALEQSSSLDVSGLLIDYNRIMRSAVSFCALAANLGDSAHFPSICRVAAITTRDPGPDTGLRLNRGLWQYPAALLIYSIGLSALQKKRLTLIRDLLLSVCQEVHHREDSVCLVDYISWGEISKYIADIYRPSENQIYKMPLSEYLYKELSALVGAYFIDDREYDHIFDEFEYVLGLAYASNKLRSGRSVWVPPGRYMCKRDMEQQIIDRLHAEVDTLGSTEIFFDGNKDWVEETIKVIRTQSTRIGL